MPEDTIIQALQAIHAEHGYLPAGEVRRAAECVGVPLSQAFSVATFYRAFSLAPRGRRVVRVCVGTACHVRGARDVVEALERALAIRAGETTPDRAVTLEVVKCVGACAVAPVVVVGEKGKDRIVSGSADCRLLIADCLPAAGGNEQ